MSKQGKSASPDERQADAAVVAACERLGLDPATVLASKVYADRVVVVAADGRKLQVER
jgi:hypothetical protein